MTVKRLTKHPLEFLTLKEGCTGSSESTLVKMSNCWKSHVMAHFMIKINVRNAVTQSKKREVPHLRYCAHSGKSATNRKRVVLCTKKLHFVSRNWCMENKFCIMCVQLVKSIILRLIIRICIFQ